MHKPLNGMEGMGFEPITAVHGFKQSIRGIFKHI